ncbi:MAG TPA: mechanosensitive ion channel family protein [bacterium]|jgi:small-conductance mechanosensitive channel
MISKYLDVVTLSDIFIALSFVLGGIALGWIAERILLRRLSKLAERTPTKIDDVVIASLRGMPLFWFILAGIYGALRYLAISGPVLANIHKALLIVGLFSLTVVAARIAGSFAGAYSRKAIGAERSVSIFINAVRLSVYLLGLLMILQSVGISIAPILTALGVGGLAVALALQDTLSNLFAGLQIIAVRKVKIGEYIRLDTGQDGYVTDITWRYTEILSPAGNTILVPNAKLVNAIVTNYYQPKKDLGASLEVTVKFGSDLQKVEQISLDVAKDVAATVPGMVPGAQPAVMYVSFTDLGVRYSIGFQVKEFNDQGAIKHALIKRLQQRFEKEGIQFASPVAPADIPKSA